MQDSDRIVVAPVEDRFARFQLISWWEQERLARAKVLVIGAGALGNEILKNLALLGVGSVLVADRDRIENSNLSRSVLFRAEDCGKPKADVAAARAREIYTAMRVQSLMTNIVHDLGLGVYRWADVVMGGLDNREARVAINRAAARAGKIWIDGAIERLQGVARVFDPACGPCYECTMNETDWKMLQARRSCALLTRDEMEEGKVPTVSTTASVIAGIQCQEAVKLIHGLETLSGRGFVFEGMMHQSYVVAYTRKDDCPSHDPDSPVETLPLRVRETRVGDFLERVRSNLGPEAVIEANSDLLSSLYCANCQEEEPLLASLGSVSERQGRCPKCGQHRAPNLYHTIPVGVPPSGGIVASGINNLPPEGGTPTGTALLDRTLGELGIPPWDVLAGRCGMKQSFYEFAGDRDQVLGCLRDREDADMAEKSESPDVAQLAGEKLPDAVFPGGGHKDFRVYFDRSVHARVVAHLAEKLSVEVMGVLVGRWHRDADGPFVLVSESVRCDKAKSQSGDVTLTHDAWNEVNREMDTRFTELSIVGWYHSHPSFGVFLSERDCFIQQHFFYAPGQIAYVGDPVAKTEGVFIWRDGRPKLSRQFWVGDEIHLSNDAAAQTPPAGVQSASDNPQPRPAEPPLLTPAFLYGAIVAMLCLLLGLYMGGKKTDWEQAMIERGAVRHYGLVKGLRPGLRENLGQAETRLQAIAMAVDILAKEHVALVGNIEEKKGETEEKKKEKQKEKDSQWGEVRNVLQDTRQLVRNINAIYSLSPEESAEVERLIEARDAEKDGVQKLGTKPEKEKPTAKDAKGQEAASKEKSGDKRTTKVS